MLTSRIRHVRNRKRSRGQSMVEFALVFPVILLLLMVAIDFGRVYLGWINLQNMARIAANYAAINAPDFQTADASTLAKYQRQVLNDATASNCALLDADGNKTNTAPPPAFSGYAVGDSVRVELDCSFSVITPVISNILGNSLTVSASSEFPVKTGIIAAHNTGGGGGGPGTPVAASFSCTPTSGALPLFVTCSDESGGGPNTWAWEITLSGTTVFTGDTQDFSFTLTDPGLYDVRLTADNDLNQPDDLFRGGYINAANASLVDFTSDKNTGNAPLTVKFFDASTNGPTAWDWDFDSNGTIDATGASPTHVFNNPGSYDVTLTVTNPAGKSSLKKTGFIVVDPPVCTVPPFTGVKRNQAQNKWTQALFTTQVQDALGAPNGQGWTIQFQSITPGTVVPCSSLIEVNDH